MELARPEKRQEDEIFEMKKSRGADEGDDQSTLPSAKIPIDHPATSMTQQQLKKFEKEHRARVKRPWLLEAKELVSEPPFINYRRLILDDQEIIERSLENHTMHFVERCLKYQGQDAWLETQIFEEFKRWTDHMVEPLSVVATEEEKLSSLNSRRSELHDKAKECEREKAISALNLPADESTLEERRLWLRVELQLAYRFLDPDLSLKGALALLQETAPSDTESEEEDLHALEAEDDEANISEHPEEEDRIDSSSTTGSDGTVAVPKPPAALRDQEANDK